MRISAKANSTNPLNLSVFTEYLTLCKPRVVMLMILTSMVGMCLARPLHFSWLLFCLGNIGIALVASGAAAINHLVDRHIDRVMHRTKNRPIVTGNITAKNAMIFAAILSITGMTILIEYVNTLTAMLTFAALVGYAGIYTGYLKHATPQNIVIGGLAGAAPPLLGWVAMTDHVGFGAVALLLIIFVWTPPHFWALAIHRVDEYAKADVPMLPVTHGILHTKINILVYAIILFFVSLLPFFIGMSSWIYLIAAVVLGARFIQWAIRLMRSDDSKIALLTFRFSITYLMALFLALVIDRFL
jgi:protoheme IX farnesyltransferase